MNCNQVHKLIYFDFGGTIKENNHFFQLLRDLNKLAKMKSGRALSIRLAAAIGGFEFEDVRISRTEFDKQKQEEKEKFPYAALPVFYAGDKLIVHSNSILR